MLRYQGKRVLLTGAGSGIGRATALRVLSEGAAVYGVDLSAEGLAETAELAGDVGSLTTAVCDVTDEQQIIDTVTAAVTALGGLDVLFNIAGTHRTTPIERLTAADLRLLFEVNLIGTALFCREAVPHLQRGSAIVNVASLSAVQGTPYMSAYSASKGAVRSFSISLAAELVKRGIRVVPVSPGQVVTPLTTEVAADPDLDFSYFPRVMSLLGPAQPEQLAAALAWAGSDDASYFTGADLRVDGGSDT